MVVKLDLRTNKQETKQKVETNVRYYLLFSLATLFLITSALLFLFAGWRFYSARVLRADFTESIGINNDRLAMLSAELNRLKKQNGSIEEKLDYSLGDIPSLELLTDLSEHSIDGIVIESLIMTKDTATIKGVAFADDEVLQLGDELLQGASIESLSLPIITTAQRNGVDLKAFSLELKLRPLQKAVMLAASGAVKSDGTVSGDEETKSGEAPKDAAPQNGAQTAREDAAKVLGAPKGIE